MLRSFQASLRVCGQIYLLLCAGMMICATIDYLLGGSATVSFLLSAMGIGLLGFAALNGNRSRRAIPDYRTVFLAITLVWTSVSVLGAVPLYLALDIPLVDALFESASGLTTTGATVLSDLDEMSPGLLIWRSLLQWLGGIGILALGLVLLPTLGVGGMQISKTESSDISELSRGRQKQYSLSVLGIYGALTAICAACYAALGMTNFDAINHAMTTIATGGFSTHDASFGHYGENTALLATASAFMFLSSIPFSIYVALQWSNRIDWASRTQLVWYVAVLALFLFMLLDTAHHGTTDNLADVVFNLISISSTTGFASSDYQRWGPEAFFVIILVTALGGCAGSTSGGLKVYRVIYVFGFFTTHIAQLSRPHVVTRSHLEIRKQSVRYYSVIAFLSAFAAALVLGTIALLTIDLDPLTSFSAVLTALSNVGPGLGPLIGPSGTFECLPDAAKWVVISCMLLGRLEILAVLVLLSPSFWR